MIYYANPSTESIRDAIAAGQLGCIITPNQGNVTFPDEWDVLADNGAFSAKWEPDAWWAWLTNQPRSISWAVCPDIYKPGECHTETLELWRTWGPRIERAGFRPLFVAQIGATPAGVPGDAHGVFLGGSTEWKLSHQATAIVESVKASGRWAHMGRVNSHRRLRAAAAMGCDSADGTYLTFGPDVNLPKLLAWLADLDERPMLPFREAVGP